MIKLTPARRAALTYYLWLADKSGPKPKSSRDPRVLQYLCDEGLLDNVGHFYGPLLGITAKGRAALAG